MSSEKWTISQIPNLEGKTIIVTGGNSGLGYQAVKAFAEKGAELIIACRSVAKGKAARTEILHNHPKAKIEVMQLDLSDLESVRAFVTDFNKKYSQLHVLLNNAGIMMTPYSKTKDGIELQQGTNHFGHFALTGLLIDKLKTTPKSRVVNVSSLAHKNGNMDFSNLLFDNGKSYSPMSAYSRSKLENLLFTFELQRYFDTNKIDCITTVAHPGVSDTNLFNGIGNNVARKLFMPLFRAFVQPASMGALPLIRAAMDEKASPANYYGPNGLGQIKGYPMVVKADKHAYKADDAKRLWDLSEKLTGVKF
jgi:NAD(P)-dependent dehydrogenase (short-subunit alcohol dehydrogenase family)